MFKYSSYHKTAEFYGKRFQYHRNHSPKRFDMKKTTAKKQKKHAFLRNNCTVTSNFLLNLVIFSYLMGNHIEFVLGPLGLLSVKKILHSTL